MYGLKINGEVRVTTVSYTHLLSLDFFLSSYSNLSVKLLLFSCHLYTCSNLFFSFTTTFHLPRYYTLFVFPACYSHTFMSFIFWFSHHIFNLPFSPTLHMIHDGSLQGWLVSTRPSLSTLTIFLSVPKIPLSFDCFYYIVIFYDQFEPLKFAMKQVNSSHREKQNIKIKSNPVLV